MPSSGLLRARARDALERLRDTDDPEAWARHEIGIDDPVFIARAEWQRNWWVTHPDRRSTVRLLPVTIIDDGFGIVGESAAEAAWRAKAEQYFRLPDRGSPVDWLWNGWIADGRRVLDDLEKMLHRPARRGRKPETDRDYQWFVECHLHGRRAEAIARMENVSPSAVSRGKNAVARRLGVQLKPAPSRLGVKDKRPRRRDARN
jgi:hypothetical protein